MIYLAIVLMAVVLDVFYALYVRRSAQGRAVQASCYATGIALTTGFVTISYVQYGYKGVIAFAVGSYIGTYYTIKGDVK